VAAFSEISYLKRRNQTLILGLRKRFDEIYSSDFPTSTPSLIIDLIRDILVELSNQVESSSDEDYLILVSRLVQSFGGFLEFVDNAHTDQTPRALVQILEDILGTIDPNSNLLAWPQAKYNYSILDILPVLKRMTENAFNKSTHDQIFHKYPDALKLISFPRTERDNILLHSVFGHEIGHPIADDFLAIYELDPGFQRGLKTASLNVEKDLQAKISKLSGLSLVQFRKDIVDGLIKIFKRGMQELISDSVSAMIFGPSAMFALYDIFIADDLDAIPMAPEFYPPSRMRLRIVNEILTGSGYIAALKKLDKNQLPQGVYDSNTELLKQLEAIINVTDDKGELNKSPFIREAYNWIEAVLPEAIEFAKKEIEKVACSVSLVKEEVPELLTRLNLGLPPNEIGVFPETQVANWRSAILAGWLYRNAAQKIVNGHLVDMSIKDIETIHTLVLRAVEYIILSNDYAEHLKNKGG